MSKQGNTRRGFMKTVGLAAATASSGALAGPNDRKETPAMDRDFFVRPEELTLEFRQTAGDRRLAFGSFRGPAHCIPGVLNWMDRSDIAGLSAPRPIRLHYGQRDTPGPRNNSASYNETVEPSLRELRAIYKAFDAQQQVSLFVTPGRWHEMDIEDLRAFLAG